MTIFPYLVDARPAYLAGTDRPHSLLLAPLGGATLLHWLMRHVRTVTSEPLGIVPLFPSSEAYLRELQGAGAQIRHVVSDSARGLFDGLEASDSLLVIDPRCLVLSEAPLRGFVRSGERLRGARYQVALDRTHHGTREYLQLDGAGRVRRIQRYYEGHTWIQTQAVASALIPVTSMWDLSDPQLTDLPRLRRALAASGALGEDEPINAPTADLTTEAGYLMAIELLSPHKVSGLMPGEAEPESDVLIGRDCEVDSTARLYGPLVLQDGVRVGPRAVVIGPTVIGRRANIGADVTLAKCVVLPDTQVEAAAVANQRVLSGVVTGSHLPERYDLVERTRAFATALEERPRSAEQLRRERRRELYRAGKVAGEVVLACIALVLLSPVMLLTALAVKLTSRGPVFFGHQREGLNGRPFRCWKFRTMVHNAVSLERTLAAQNNEVDGPQFKQKNDPRVTPIGKFLRGSNIDELPQLFNVICGEMSLIGPRPSPFRENQICVPWRRARLSVRPGITGLWQICRHEREAGDFHQWIYYDILYAKHQSLWLDIKILFWTVMTGGGKRSVPLHWVLSKKRLLGAMPAVLGEVKQVAESKITPAPLTELAGKPRVA